MAEEQISVVLKANIDNYNKNMSIAASVLKDLQKQSAEFMKINNGVEDSFTKIEFAAKRFGETAGVLEKKLVVIKKAMTDLVVAGQENTRAFKDLDNQYKIITNRLENKAMAEAQAYAQANMTNMTLPKTKKGLDEASLSLKKNNMQWTNLALVVQDLPFGFRGIQNNLPALIGGMAGVTGGIYFATSAIIALFTAWDMGVFGATKSTNEWRKSIKETNDEIRNSTNYTNSEISNLKGLVDVMLDVNTTESIRNKALAEAKEAITKVDEAQGKKIKTYGDAIVAINLYSEAIQQQQMQEVIGKKIAEISIGQIEKRNKLAIETAKANKGIHPINFFMGNTELDNLNSEIIANETLLRQLEDLRKGNTKALLLNPFSQYNAKGGGKGGTITKDTSNLDKLKALEQYYKDDLFLRRYYSLEVLKEEERLSIQEAISKQASSIQLQNIRDQFNIKKLTVEKEVANEIQKIRNEDADNEAKYQQKLIDIAEKANEIRKRNATDIANSIKNINQKFLNDDVDAIQDKTKFDLKLNKNNRKANIQSLKDANKELLALKENEINASNDIDKSGIDKAVENNLNQIALLEQAWKDTAKSINDSINNLIANGIELFAESVGKAFAGESVDIFNSFGLLIADALINVGKSLIEYATLVGIALTLFEDPLTWPVALGVGIAAVAAGAFLKSALTKKDAKGVSKFANGGIVSGPTMGLMGEYPGAKSNPEVIAPLDKLKDLIGGGGGTLEARISGNDLLILMNKAQRNNNLSF